MSISMTCSQCGAQFSFADKNLGKKARCQRCQHVFTIEEPPPEIAAYPVLEFVEPIKETPLPAPPQPRPAPIPLRSRKQDTSADDFNTTSTGFPPKVNRSDAERANPTSRPSRIDDYKDEEPRSSREQKEGAFSHRQRRGRGKDSRHFVRRKAIPFWVRLVIFIAGFFIPGVKEVSSLIGDGSESPFERMKRKLVYLAMIFGLFMILGCGGLIFMLVMISMRR